MGGKIDRMTGGFVDGWDETVGLGRGQNTAPDRATDFVALTPVEIRNHRCMIGRRQPLLFLPKVAVYLDLGDARR